MMRSILPEKIAGFVFAENVISMLGSA